MITTNSKEWRRSMNTPQSPVFYLLRSDLTHPPNGRKAACSPGVTVFDELAALQGRKRSLRLTWTHLLWMLTDSSTRALLVFSVSSIFYSLSLAHVPRLFLNGLQSSALHWTLRTLFGLSFYLICASFSYWDKRIAALHVIPMLVLTYALNSHSEIFDTSYNLCVPIFSLITLLTTFQLRTSAITSSSGKLLQYASSVWLLSQALDIIALKTNFGPYTAPSIVALIMVLVTLIKRNEDQRFNHLERTRDQLLSAVATTESMEGKLKHVSGILQQHLAPNDIHSI